MATASFFNVLVIKLMSQLPMRFRREFQPPEWCGAVSGVVAYGHCESHIFLYVWRQDRAI